MRSLRCMRAKTFCFAKRSPDRAVSHAARYRGLTLVDVIVGSALAVIIFMGLFGLLRASLQISGLSKIKATATAVASSQIEYIRSLPYDDMGTQGGIPPGAIAQYASSTNGGLIFDVRTYIEYADDAADGLGAADTNGIAADYKHLKVTVSYTVGGITRTVTLVSNAAPKGIESIDGGGTLQVNVVNAVGAPVAGASVHIQNTDTSPTVDFTTFSDAYGIVYLPGAPTSTEYHIGVSKTGYSSASTYARDVTNENPTPGFLTVVEGSTTSSTFAIDLLASLIIRFFSPIEPFAWNDPLDDADELYSVTNVQTVAGALTLSGAPGTYAASGSAHSTTTDPLHLAEWTEASFAYSTPALTTLVVSVLDAGGVPLPESDLPGNAIGFTNTIDLSGISTTTYPELRLRASLTSSDVNVTPSLLEWEIMYEAGPNPLPDIPFTLTGAKTKGSMTVGTPVYKTTLATTTDIAGVRSMSLEWDLYTISIPGYTVVSEEPSSPYELLPGGTLDASLIITP